MAMPKHPYLIGLGDPAPAVSAVPPLRPGWQSALDERSSRVYYWLGADLLDGINMPIWTFPIAEVIARVEA